ARISPACAITCQPQRIRWKFLAQAEPRLPDPSVQRIHLEIENGSHSVHPNTMSVSPKIVELRKILAQRYPRQTGTHSLSIPTGWSSLDTLLGGGLPKGAITQLLIP